MNQHEAEEAVRMAHEQTAAFPVGSSVNYKSATGSEGEVIEVVAPTFALVGPRFKVLWTKYPRMPEGETSESGWLSYHDLIAIQPSEPANQPSKPHRM